MSLSLTLDRTYRYCCCFKKTRVMIPCVFFSSSDDNTMLHYCSRQKLGLFFGGGEKYPKSPLSPEDLQQRSPAKSDPIFSTTTDHNRVLLQKSTPSIKNDPLYSLCTTSKNEKVEKLKKDEPFS
eukprot:TRINITY_DN32601_c0_g3_i10.p1 TRINITY_DN32601_c0_g3~~TRINITY_DN32601_c0_g3_i10.p1  ORF type:complete len:124 (-),score=14.12 TRINITY_DN32601_c0_g3_i10:310-681(-)